MNFVDRKRLIVKCCGPLLETYGSVLEQAGSHSYKIIYRAVFPTLQTTRKMDAHYTGKHLPHNEPSSNPTKARSQHNGSGQQSHRQADPKIVEKSDDRLFLRALDNDNVRDGTRDGQVSRRGL